MNVIWIKASSLVLKVDARNLYMKINVIYLCETISDYERKKLLLKHSHLEVTQKTKMLQLFFSCFNLLCLN